MTLCFIDSAALYRVLPWLPDGKLIVRVERTPFPTLARVSVADNRNVGSMSRSWQIPQRGRELQPPRDRRTQQHRVRARTRPPDRVAASVSTGLSGMLPAFASRWLRTAREDQHANE
jgi:hypothetical protein